MKKYMMLLFIFPSFPMLQAAQAPHAAPTRTLIPVGGATETRQAFVPENKLNKPAAPVVVPGSLEDTENQVKRILELFDE